MANLSIPDSNAAEYRRNLDVTQARTHDVTALKMLIAGVMAAGVVTLASPAQGPTHYLSEPNDTSCAEGNCRQPARVTPPRSPRGVIGCVRGVCIPKPIRPSTPR